MIHSMRRVALRVLALVGALFLCANILVAQEELNVDVSKWNDLGTRAEVVVDDADTTDEALEELRSQIVAYRKAFDSARGVNATRIASLREQLALLTPDATDSDVVPETQEVVNNRVDLEKQLSLLLAPVQVAESAFTRADGLVNEIDAILRERQTEALFEVVDSPLNPANWAPALESLRNSWATLWVTSTPEEAAARAKILRRNLPIILFTSLAGLVLIVRGRFWAKRIVSKLQQAEARGLRIWRFVVSLLRIVFPLIGLALLTHAARTTGYLGARGNEIAMLVPVLGGMMLGFRWVADQVFAREEDEALIEMSNKDRSEARFCVSGITFLLIFNLILLQIFEFDADASLTKTVISFPFTVMISFVVFRLGRLMRHLGTQTVEHEEGETASSGTLVRLVRGLGVATIAVSIAAPLLQAAGYYNASEFLLIPAVLTLVILGLVLALQRFSADVYGTLTGQGGQAREALMPIFFGLFLLILALPVLALIWGARVSNLTEIWSAFRRGFSIGDSQISPTDFMTFALIFTVGYLATRLAQGALKTNVLPKTKIDKGAQNAIVSGLGYVGIFLAGLMAITGAGIDLSSLAIVAGALSVGIGFGLQNIVSNFVSGIILLIERPISEGDWIEVSGGQMGYVRDISVRSTRIETFDRTDVIVPNADLVSGTVTNYTRGNTLGRVIIPVGVAYGTDTKRVEGILEEIAVAHPMTLANPAPSILFVSFGASSLDFEIRMYLRDVNWMMSVKSDVNHAIAKRFVEENIEIPFAQQDVWFRNPEVLDAKPKVQAPIAPLTSVQPSELSDAAKGEGDK